MVAVLWEASSPWHFWHSAHSVPEGASWGTEYARGAQNSLLWYAAHFRKPSVLKTGFYGTEQAFGARKPPHLVPNAFLGALVLNGTFVQTGSGAFSCFTIKTRHKTPQKLQMKYSKKYK